MNRIKDELEILFWKFAKRLLKKGYGCDCETSDLEDFDNMYTKPEHVFLPGRCGSCRAKEVCVWIDDHIETIKMFK